MDEPIWIYFSIIAVIIAFGIMLSLFNQNKEHVKEQAFSDAFLTLKPHCDYMCDSTPESIRPIDVDFPSGIFIYTTDTRICGRYEGDVRCAMCKCDVAPYTLDLNTTQARDTFDIHTFKCYFERGEDEIKIDCQG